MKIAYSVDDFRGRRVAPDCVTAVESTAATLEELGHQLVEAKPRIDGQSVAEAFFVVWQSLAESIFVAILAEASKQRAGRLLRRLLGDWRAMKVIARLDKRKSGLDAFEPFTWQLADLSRRRTPAQLEAAKIELQRVSHVVAAFMEDYDVLLTTVLGSPPVRLGEIDQNAEWDEMVEQLTSYVAFTAIANFSGLPAMSVPTHWTELGLPVGTHFMGRFGDEVTMLSLAGQLERAIPWWDRRPTL
jgi:amidase